jgi:hypothetical protein
MKFTDRYKLTLNRFTCEIDRPLERDKRCFILTEADIYDVSTPDNHDGTFDENYKAKVVGATEIKQGENKPVFGKSKRSPSQRLRMAFLGIEPTEEFYENGMNKIIANLEDILEFIKDK